MRAAAESAVRGGLDFVAADLFADADLRVIGPATRIEAYPDGLRDWLAEQDVDAWMYTGALENHPELVDEMAEVRPLLGVSGEALRRARDPLFLQTVFGSAGVAFPETRLGSDAPSKGGGWLAKSYRHGSGAGVAWLRGANQSPYAQRYIEGEATSAVYAVGAAGATLLGLSRQLVGESFANAPAWGYCGSIGPIVPSARHAKTLSAIGSVLREKLGPRGIVGVDLIAAADRLTVIEINPRWTASVELWEQLYGGSAVADHVAACLGKAVAPWRCEPPPLLGKLVFFAAKRAVIVPRLTRWLRAEHAQGRAADLPHEGDVIDAGRPVCTLFTEAEDGEAVFARLRELAGEVTRRLEAAG